MHVSTRERAHAGIVLAAPLIIPFYPIPAHPFFFPRGDPHKRTTRIDRAATVPPTPPHPLRPPSRRGCPTVRPDSWGLSSTRPHKCRARAPPLLYVFVWKNLTRSEYRVYKDAHLAKRWHGGPTIQHPLAPRLRRNIVQRGPDDADALTGLGLRQDQRWRKPDCLVMCRLGQQAAVAHRQAHVPRCEPRRPPARLRAGITPDLWSVHTCRVAWASARPYRSCRYGAVRPGRSGGPCRARA